MPYRNAPYYVLGCIGVIIAGFGRMGQIVGRMLRAQKIDIIQTHDFYTNIFGMAAAALAIHAVGYFLCLREPRVFDLWLTKVSRCPRVRNYKRWGCNSYSP